MDMLRRSFSRTISRCPHHQIRTLSEISEERIQRYCKGGYHPVSLGDTFHNRYLVLSKLGYGVYSTVWLARDLSAKPTYELEILKHIKQTDATHPGHGHVVHLLDDFIHKGPNGNHLCLVMNVMGHSVLRLHRSFPKDQLPAHFGRQIAKQVLEALDWLHHSCGVIHTDLKADNILVEIPCVDKAVESHLDNLQHSFSDQSGGPIIASQALSPQSMLASSDLKIRISDFGVASWSGNHLTEWIQPPSLRAPEVFLGAPWDCSVDIWGFACMIYELIQGRVLFQGRSGSNDAWTAEEDHIAQMIELFGPFPEALRKEGKFSGNYLRENGDLRHIKHLYPYSLTELLAQTSNPSMLVSEYDDFEAFLRKMLCYEPIRRKLPQELLQDAWVRAIGIRDKRSPNAISTGEPTTIQTKNAGG